MKRIYSWIFISYFIQYVNTFFIKKQLLLWNKTYIRVNDGLDMKKKLYNFKNISAKHYAMLEKQKEINPESNKDSNINNFENDVLDDDKVSKNELNKKEKNPKRKKKKKNKKKNCTDIRCKTCGKFLKPKEKFCNSCGTNVSVEKIKLKKYIEDIYLPLRKDEVSENTYRVEKGFWKDILQKLGKYELKELGPNNWEGFLKYLKGKNCSPRTLALYQSTYQQSLKYAVYRDYLKVVPHFRKIKKSTIPRRKVTPLTPKEIELLLKNSSAMHRAIFGLSIGVGLRPSEVLTVLWEDVNFDKKEIFIKGQKTKYSNTPIPLTNFAYNELFRWWEIEKKPLKGLCFYSEMINDKFLYTDKRTPLKTFKTALKGAAKRAGLEVTEDGRKRRIFPYLLRHSFATIAATSNPPVPLAVAQAIMRHCSSRMLLDTYTKAGNNIIRDGLDNFKI